MNQARFYQTTQPRESRDMLIEKPKEQDVIGCGFLPDWSKI